MNIRFGRYPMIAVLTIGLTGVTTVSYAAPSSAQMSDAVCDGSLDRVKSLLAQGYGINQPLDESGNTPLTLASYCYGGKAAIAAYLIQRGADVNRHSKNGYSNLMWALRSVDREGDAMHQVVWTMVRRGANLNWQDPVTGRTALMGAAGNGDEALVQYMLERGASKTPKTKGDWCISGSMTQCTAADYARMEGHVQLALRIEGKNPKPYENTLHYAVKTKNTDRVQTLIAQKVDVNEAEELSKLTPLHYAVDAESASIVKILLDAGAHPSPISYAGTSPLRDAIVYHRREIAKVLIDGGARGDLEQQQGCGGGLTEFGWAVEYGEFEIAELLILKDRLDLQGGWALFRPLSGRTEKSVQLAKMLLDRGARPPEDYIARLESWHAEYNFEYAPQIVTLVKEQANTQTEVVTPEMPPEQPEWVFVDRSLKRNLMVKQRSLKPETQKRILRSTRFLKNDGRLDLRGDLPPG